MENGLTTIAKDETIDEQNNDNILGNCFVSAYRNVCMNKRYKLVHGVVTSLNKLKGVRHVHAWCEFEGKVYDTEANLVVDKNIYYMLGQIELTVSYTFEEAVQNTINTGHYGWWNNIFDKYDNKELKNELLNK